MNIFTPQPQQQQLNANDWAVVTLKLHWPDNGSHGKALRRTNLGSTVSHWITLRTELQQRPVWQLPRRAIDKRYKAKPFILRLLVLVTMKRKST